MNRKRRSKKHILLFSTAAYFGAVCTCLAIALLVVWHQKKTMTETAGYHMAYYTENHSFLSYREAENTKNTDHRSSGHTDDLIYTSDGFLFDSSVQNKSSSQGDSLVYDRYITKYLSIFQDNQTENIRFWIIRFSSGIHFEMAVLLPMEDEHIFFHVDSLYVFNQWMPAAFRISFLLFFCCALPLSLVIRKSRTVEMTQKNYIDNITHELKSPISAVRILTETIHDGMITDEEEKKEYCRIMLNELDNLDHTITEMLELSKIQNEMSDCPKKSFTVSEIFDSVIHKYTALCSEQEILFICDLPKNNPKLYTNQEFSRRILDILLDNAVKFCGKEKEIHVTAREDAQQISIHVKNSGCMIPPEKQPYIFTRFYQADKSHHEKGCGLGLSIAIELSGCLTEHLWLERSDCSGTEFAFTIHKSERFLHIPE